MSRQTRGPTVVCPLCKLPQRVGVIRGHVASERCMNYYRGRLKERPDETRTPAEQELLRAVEQLDTLLRKGA